MKIRNIALATKWNKTSTKITKTGIKKKITLNRNIYIKKKTNKNDRITKTSVN